MNPPDETVQRDVDWPSGEPLRDARAGEPRSASVPTQRAAASSDLARRLATATAAVLSARLRLPIARSAMFAAFLTKLRSSAASRSMSSRPRTNASLPAPLSWTLRLHSRRKRRALLELLVRLLHSATLAHACGDRSNRLKLSASQKAQLSKSRHQRSMTAGVSAQDRRRTTRACAPRRRPWPTAPRRAPGPGRASRRAPPMSFIATP